MLAYEHPYQSPPNSGRSVEHVVGALTEEVRQMRGIELSFQLGRKLSYDSNKKCRLSPTCVAIDLEKPFRIAIMPVGEVLVLMIVKNPLCTSPQGSDPSVFIASQSPRSFLS